MRVLVDECLNWRICRALSDEHDCTSVQKMGWGGITNGDLLALAQDQCDVLITGDRNLSFQQNISNYHIAVIVLHAPTTKLDDTLFLMEQVKGLLPKTKPGEIVHVYPQ